MNTVTGTPGSELYQEREQRKNCGKHPTVHLCGHEGAEQRTDQHEQCPAPDQFDVDRLFFVMRARRCNGRWNNDGQ